MSVLCLPLLSTSGFNSSILNGEKLIALSKTSAHEQVHLWHWLVLCGIIIVLLVLDFQGHIRKAHEPTISEAGIWSAIYMLIAAAFGLLVWWQWNLKLAAQYWAGWITEWSLSLDNLFVFIIILAAFKVPRCQQQKVIMSGIIISMILRLGFILVGAAIISRFAGIFYLFGIFLIYTALKQASEGITTGEESGEEEYHENRFTQLVRKIFPVSEGFVGGKLLYRHSGKTYLTPLLLVILAVGSADLMFAFDSIPAIFGLTSHPYIVFAATAFSLLGLRQLYFLIDGLLEKLAFLHYGLALILGFIGIKLIIHATHEAPFWGIDKLTHNIPEPGIGVSMTFIFSVLILTAVASTTYSYLKKKGSKI